MAVGTILLGRYRLERVLGTGGLGTVYSALALDTGERVAVKVLRSARVRHDALAAATLDHPHVVKVHDLVASRDGGVLATELLDGVSLRAYLARSGRVRGAWIKRVARQILAALERAGRSGLVHRDVNPDNVFLVGDPARPHVKLLDFGLVDRARDPFMPPEQALAQKVDGRADVYALGATLYFALTGQRPHEAAGVDAPTFAASAIPAPPVRDLRPDVGRALCDVVDRALAKDPADRWQSAADMARALSRARGRKRRAPARAGVGARMRLDARSLASLARLGVATRHALGRADAWVLGCVVVFAVSVALGFLAT